MQVPRRKSEQSRKFQHPAADDAFLTAAAMRRMEAEVERLEKQERPKVAEEVARTKEMGDLSENAAYTEAKFHLRRINDRVSFLRARLARAVVVPEGAAADGVIRVGCTVTIAVNGEERTYHIVGSQEADPGRGRISQLSPLGASLLGKRVGDTVTRQVGGNEQVYKIVGVE